MSVVVPAMRSSTVHAERRRARVAVLFGCVALAACRPPDEPHPLATSAPLATAAPSAAATPTASASGAPSAPSGPAAEAEPPPPETAEGAAPAGCGPTWDRNARPLEFPAPQPAKRVAQVARCRRTSAAKDCTEAAATVLASLPEVSWASLPEQVASVDARQIVLDEALDVAGRACTGGDVEGCALLGLAELSSGHDPAVATSRLEPACTTGYTRACRWLGQHHYSRYADDNAVAFAYYDRACTGGDVEGCISAAGARMSLDPAVRDTPASRRAALRHCGMRMAWELCEAGHAGPCQGLAYLYLDGSLATDPERALDYFERACSGGNPRACGAITELYGSRAAWQALKTPQACAPEPRYAPFTVVSETVPRIATNEPALVAPLRAVHEEMLALLAWHRNVATDTARSLSGDPECRAMSNCSCRGPAAKCVRQSCEVTRNDGVRLAISCRSYDDYSPRPSAILNELRYQRVGDALVRLEHLRDLLPLAGPLAKRRFVEAGAAAPSGTWNLDPRTGASMAQVLLAPRQIFLQESPDWRSPRRAVPYDAVKAWAGCGPLAALVGNAAVDDGPLGYGSAPLAFANPGEWWWTEDEGVPDADVVPWSSHLPQQQAAVASLDGWLQHLPRQVRNCALHLSTPELVSMSCADTGDRVTRGAALALGPSGQSRVVRVRDGAEVTLAAVLPDPARQLALVAARCFDVVASPSYPGECQFDLKCLKPPRDSVDTRPALGLENVRAFFLTASGVAFRIEAAVKQAGEDAVGYSTCTVPYAELGLSLAALGR
ncbi:MAG: sel1 repeat family protein [Polyangiaceae bacterium]|nr:sel1 repeat family protein [Polyangiaceae bacterium]